MGKISTVFCANCLYSGMKFLKNPPEDFAGLIWTITKVLFQIKQKIIKGRHEVRFGDVQVNLFAGVRLIADR